MKKLLKILLTFTISRHDMFLDNFQESFLQLKYAKSASYNETLTPAGQDRRSIVQLLLVDIISFNDTGNCICHLYTQQPSENTFMLPPVPLTTCYFISSSCCSLVTCRHADTSLENQTPFMIMFCLTWL